MLLSLIVMAGIHVAMPDTVLLKSPWTDAGVGIA